MSVNIDSFINSFVANSQNAKLPTNNSKKYVQEDNIFAAAKVLVASYKSEQNSSGTSKSGLTSGMTISQLANMSTSQFLNYAYENKASSGYSDGADKDTGIKFPAIISYDGMVISTAGKSLMQIVAKVKGKYSYLSEEKIAARLISEYATDKQISQITKKYATGNTLNFSA